MLPSVGGLDVLRKLGATYPTPILMLTARGDDVDRIVGLELGADDYLSKPFNPRELVARIRAILRRANNRPVRGNAPEELSVGPIALNAGTRQVQVAGKAVPLTGAEFRVLELLMRSAGQVISRDSMTEQALGRKLAAYDRSIDTHISNLRRKLELEAGKNPEIKNVRGSGYTLTWAACIAFFPEFSCCSCWRWRSLSAAASRPPSRLPRAKTNRSNSSAAPRWPSKRRKFSPAAESAH